MLFAVALLCSGQNATLTGTPSSRRSGCGLSWTIAVIILMLNVVLLYQTAMA